MGLRIGILFCLLWLAAAGPIAWDASKCSQQCDDNEVDSKYQYSPQTSYTYSYESKNKLTADNAPLMDMGMRATVNIRIVSKCEAVLELSSVSLTHGPLHETSSSFIDDLQRHPLPFAWHNGKVDHVCPHPADSNDVNNVKKAIISALQNSQRNLEANLYEKEVDVLGSCDTSYEPQKVGEVNIINKFKNIELCTDHLKGHTLLLAQPYESSSFRQHLPLLNSELMCVQHIKDGILEKVTCDEVSHFKPLAEYGYVVNAKGSTILEKVSTSPSPAIQYTAPMKESLSFKYTPNHHKDDHAEEKLHATFQRICSDDKGIIPKDAGTGFHKMVYRIRGLDEATLEKLYNEVSDSQKCQNSLSAKSLFKDALKAASSGGSIALLAKLVKNGDMTNLESRFWAVILPFTSYTEEESVASALPLLDKDTVNKHILLGVPSMAYKYCATHGHCENSQAIKDVSAKLLQYLGDKCQTTNDEEESQVITALKAFGNLGYIGDSADSIFECASLDTNKIAVRIAAVEAFRRAPCNDQILSHLLGLYKNKNEEDEVRIASLIALSKCPTTEIIRNIVQVYSTESSQQVEVFTWSYLKNIEDSTDPVKPDFGYLGLEAIHTPHSTDITKFSRNFQASLFSELLNMGHEFEANVIRSRNSFLPRTYNYNHKVDFFGNQFDLFEGGLRMEDFEHLLEKVFGPHGVIPNLELEDLLAIIPENEYFKRGKRSAESYKSKIDSLHEKYGYNRGKDPHGSVYFRVLGHELTWLQLNEKTFEKLSSLVDFNQVLESIANKNSIHLRKNLLFVDLAILVPSVTGRAYKLAINGSLTVGLQAEGTVDLRQPDLPLPKANIDGKFKPSFIDDAVVSFTIHSENYEPGIKIETVLHAGLDLEAKFEMRDGRFLHAKFKRGQQKQELVSLKRALYSINHEGVKEMPKPESYNLNYCSKYIQFLLGAKYCASLTIPHFYNADGKLKIPFLRAMEASISVEITDPNMNGYEFLLELPDLKANNKHFKFLLDTPNSEVNRKMAIDLHVQDPSPGERKISLSLENPLYSLTFDSDRANKDDAFHLKVDVVGNKKRKYSLILDVPKNSKGAKLIEYNPKLSLNLHNVRPIELTGTIVASKGKRDQIQINLQSESFDSPFNVKGKLIKEGDIDLDSNFKLQSEHNITAFNHIYRMHTDMGNTAGKGMFFHLGRHHEPDGKAYESITVNANIKNLQFRDRLAFNLESEVLLAEHQDLNSQVKWDFSFKPLEHWRNDFMFKYGENFDIDDHLVHFTHIFALGGDFDSFHQLDIENKLGLTIGCLDFDKSAVLSLAYDLVDKPKLYIEAGIKAQTDNEMNFKFDYKHVSANPLKMTTEAQLIYHDHKILYRDQAQEIGPYEYQGKAVIEPSEGKQVTVDYVLKTKGQDDRFHYEFDGTAHFPGRSLPVRQKLMISYMSNEAKFSTFTETGSQTPYSLDVTWHRNGKSNLDLNTPYIEGNAEVEKKDSTYSIDSNFKSKTSDDRRVKFTGSLTPGDTNTLHVEVLWDADKDAQKKIIIHGTSHKENDDGNPKHVIAVAVTYAESVDVDIKGKFSTDILHGPHNIRADFSGNMQDLSLEFAYSTEPGHINGVAKYLRSNVEKIRVDMKGKFIFNNIFDAELEGGIFLSSPYKAFDGKEIYVGIKSNSDNSTRNFVTEYRLKPAAVIGYIGKLDYQRRRGYPGGVKSNLLVTVHQRPIYEGSTNIEYGNGKYLWKTTFSPISKRKVSLLSSFEHSGKFAAFHHSVATSFQYLQKLELNAVADLRDLEDAKVTSNLDVNSRNMYDVNSTLKVRTMFDFDGQVVILSRITPSLHVFYKGQPSGQLTKYEMNVDIDGQSMITGSGEIKTRKKGFNGDLVLLLKEQDFLALAITQEIKSQKDIHYTFKTKSPLGDHNSILDVKREKKDTVKYESKICRAEEENTCIELDLQHVEMSDHDDYQLTYTRDIYSITRAFTIHRTDGLTRVYTVLSIEEKPYGYELKRIKESKGISLSLGIILPSREIVTKTTIEPSLEKPKAKFEFQADAKNHPDRKLVTNIKFENHLLDDKASKLDVSISHPTFEKAIDLQLVADYKPTANKFFTATASMDYSSDPEDKLIGKLGMEKHKDKGNMILNIYHKDTQDEHLDFVVKTNCTMNDHDRYIGLHTMWKEDGADKEAHIVSHYAIIDRKFYFEYMRPTLSYRLDAEVVPTQNLLAETTEVDLSSTYNGDVTKAKLFMDRMKNCYKLSVFDNQDKKIRQADLCMNHRSRKILSLVMVGLDDTDQWQLEANVNLIRVNWHTLKQIVFVDTDFLGGLVFKATTLGEELAAAGVGKPPFHNTPRYQKIRDSLYAKIFEPAKSFLLPEVTAFLRDVLKDMGFLRVKLIQYYNDLPPLTKIRAYFREKSEKIMEVIHQLAEPVVQYYKLRLKNVIEFVEKAEKFVKNICDSNENCKAFVEAYKEGGWRGLLKQFRVYLLNIPERIQKYLDQPGIDLRSVYNKIVVLTRAVLQPLKKCKCGEIFVKLFEVSHQKMDPYIQKFLTKYPQYVKSVKDSIRTNPYVVQSTKYAKEAYANLKSEIQKIDFNQWYKMISRSLEEYLYTLKPGRFYMDRRPYEIHEIKHGRLHIDLHFSPQTSLTHRIISRIIYRTVEGVVDGVESLISGECYKKLTIFIKRAADFNLLPPYDTQAMIVGNHHFITFDKTIYDFQGECSYLLTRDFEDGNFTFALQPNEANNAGTVLAIYDDVVVEIDRDAHSVKVGDTPVELPYKAEPFIIYKEENSIKVSNRHGVCLECNFDHQLCTFSISGWYFGKTAGLLGTYNYEHFDEFKRPKGQIANSPGTLAKGWELKKGCKTTNLAQDTKLSENSEEYKLCKDTFDSDSSELSACFSEVCPKKYFSLCLRHSTHGNKNFLCDVAAAYAKECEKNYLEINLPKSCLNCTAPDGAVIEHGDRKQFTNLKQKTADIVFIIEDHECNKGVMTEISNIAKNIDKELQNEGFKDNHFGVVGYDKDGSLTYTVKGQSTFGSKDVGSVKDRLKTENKDHGADAFDAIGYSVTSLTRTESTKNFILISCTTCKYDYKSLKYPVIQQTLLERGITLHIISNAEIKIRKKSNKYKDLIGLDADTVYHSRDVTQQDLLGDPALRSHVIVPKDLCIALSQDVSGSFFSSHSLSDSPANEIKNWRSVFARKVAKAVQSFPCQYCDCVATRDHVSKTVCHPCEPKRPKLPFSVCKSCAYGRTAEAFLSYVRHLSHM